MASSVTTALKSISAENQVSIIDHATQLASLAWDDAALGMKFGDPHCMPNHIKMLKRLHPDMRFVKIDKNAGTCWLVCEVLWAQLFIEQFLISSQYDIVRQCDTVDQAKSELMDLIAEARTELSIPTHWAKHTKHLPGFASIPPTGMMLLKDKSKEWEVLMQVCLIVSHFHHPSSHEGSLVGRCLSLLIKSFSELWSNLEVWNMQECKQRFTTACDSAASDPMESCGAEPDMVIMYTEIPTPHVRDAVIYALSKVLEGRRSRHRISGVSYLEKREVRGPTGFRCQLLFCEYTPAPCPGLN